LAFVRLLERASHETTAEVCCCQYDARGRIPALAQQAATPSTGPSTASTSTSETRPATNTYLGDTGLWFVPTGEVLPAKRMSGGGYYVNQDFTEAFMDVSDFSAVAAYGLGNKAEVFGSFQFYRRIDTDRRPLQANGHADRLSQPVEGWQTGVGDIYVGAKYSFMSQPTRSLWPPPCAAS
jgi:hypothetical protein